MDLSSLPPEIQENIYSHVVALKIREDDIRNAFCLILGNRHLALLWLQFLYLKKDKYWIQKLGIVFYTILKAHVGNPKIRRIPEALCFHRNVLRSVAGLDVWFFKRYYFMEKYEKCFKTKTYWSYETQRLYVTNSKNLLLEFEEDEYGCAICGGPIWFTFCPDCRCAAK